MSDYTPGPWRTNKGYTDNLLYRGTVAHLGETPEGEWVAVIVEDDERAWHTSDADVMRANANLIAAAPDLLEAAKEARRLLIDALRDVVDVPGWNPESHFDVRMLTEIIAKAEGREGSS